MSDIDAVTLAVLQHACEGIATEMNATLVRTGYSPNIKERRDCSCALFDAQGEMISQAETLPVHLGAMPFSVAAAIDRFPPATLSVGDAILLNDPFAGGAHLPDLTLVSPVFEPDQPAGPDTLLGYCANRAHHADVGGATAGSVSAETTEIYQEGIRIPPVKLYAGGAVNEAVEALLFANVRTPDERRGDLRAQQAANETGIRRLHDLAETHGVDELRSGFEAMKDYSERRMRGVIAELPDGAYSFRDRLDDDGQGNTALEIAATVTIADESIDVDFAGTSPQTEGPVNAVFAVTASATYYAMRCLTDPDIPPNHGCYRPISIETPSASLVDAKPPAAVVGGNLEVSQRVTDVILGAIGETLPERSIAACQGTMNNLTIGGHDPRRDRPYAFYETEGGGMGGRASGDGVDGIQVHMTNTMNTPIEVLETAYPLRVRRYELRPDTGGAGAHRGGLGLRRDIEMCGHDATVSILAERRIHAPYGLAGGEPGSLGEDVIINENETVQIAGKSVHRLSDGEIISIRTPGGGGYGDPNERDPEAIRADIRLGKLSRAVAIEQYGLEEDSEQTLDIVEESGTVE